MAHHDCRLVFLPPSASATSAIAIHDSEEHITIRVGRCSCQLAESHHLLAVMVSSIGRTSPLEKDFQSPRHNKDHPAHIHSWKFSGGFASKEISLESTEYFRPTINLRLTFSHDTQHAAGGSRTKIYRLGVEIWSTLADPPLSTSPVSLEAAPMTRTLSYSEVAASPPVRQSVLATPASRSMSLYPGRLASQESRPRTSMSNAGPHRQHSGIPQQTTRQAPSLTRPHAPTYSRHGNITEPVTRRASSVVAPPIRTSQSASSVLGSYGTPSPSRTNSQYSNDSQATIRPGPGPRYRQPTTNGAFNASILSRGTSRTPSTSRRTSTRGPSPIDEFGEPYEHQRTATPIRQNGGLHTPNSTHRQTSRLYQGSGVPSQQRSTRQGSHYQDNGQGRSRVRGRDGSGQWEHQVEEDSDL